MDQTKKRVLLATTIAGAVGAGYYAYKHYTQAREMEDKKEVKEAEAERGLSLVSSVVSLVEEEVKTQAFWEENKCFEESLQRSEGRPEFTFYDGPPFATGLPHYGHILAGTIKDVITRFAHQSGFFVSRRFGWDCHGLPVECEVDKKLKVKSRADVVAMGIDKYNDECRSIVMRYAKEWEVVVKRMGRWIDFENDYKTLNASFMESVWWVFKQFFDKGLVYQGFKVMPFSTACHTPLSNFECSQNYKDVQDPAVIVSFPLDEDPEVKLLAWTTTPWTLPSNLALAINPEFAYVKVKDLATGQLFVVAECRLEQLYKPKKGKKAKKKEYELVGYMAASSLLGKTYKPLFPFFADMKAEGAFRVIAADYVTADTGTGVVHEAPAFGEDDYRCCMAAGIVQRGGRLPCPVDENGDFTAEVGEFAGMYVKTADRLIIQRLKQMGRLVNQSTYTHSYPHCWRSDTPLIYKSVPSWFIDVPKIRDRLVHNNTLTHWVPAFVKEKRFHNWLVNAREWAVSRNRFWGTPLPVWTSEDFEEVVCVGSIAELEELTGVSGLTDIHRDKIDHLTIPSRQGKGALRRVDEVFDCWFESGSMPYGQVHYPFEHKEAFESRFPADFIAEGLDQTRGWFYTLMVISTALFDKPAFKHLIVNGLVLDRQGKKMSKSKKNFEDPLVVVGKCGADALRLYLINSPVVRAEPLKFRTEGVRDVVKTIFLPWFNTYRFLCEQVRRYERATGLQFLADLNVHKNTHNVMDHWILSSLESLTQFVHVEMAEYRLYTVIPKLVEFVDSLSKWFVRFNKLRLKGEMGPEETYMALATLFHVLYQLCRLMAPFTPFLVEYMYQNLKKVLPAEEVELSVHFLSIPKPRPDLFDVAVETAVGNMQAVIDLGRTVRERNHISFRLPVTEITVVHQNREFLDSLRPLEGYLRKELNAYSVVFSHQLGDFIQLKPQADMRALGRRLKQKLKTALPKINNMRRNELEQLQREGEFQLPGLDVVVLKEEVDVVWEYCGDREEHDAESSLDKGVVVVLATKATERCLAESRCREFMSRVQRMRKNGNLISEDEVEVFYTLDRATAPQLATIVDEFGGYVEESIGVRLYPLERKTESPLCEELLREDVDVLGERITLVMCRQRVIFANESEVRSTRGWNLTLTQVPEKVRAALVALDCEDRVALRVRVRSAADVSVRLDGHSLRWGRDFFFSLRERQCDPQYFCPFKHVARKQ